VPLLIPNPSWHEDPKIYLMPRLRSKVNQFLQRRKYELLLFALLQHLFIGLFLQHHPDQHWFWRHNAQHPSYQTDHGFVWHRRAVLPRRVDGDFDQ
jgi:hypothetical protein